MQIKFISCNVENKGKYQQANVTYEINGKVETKPIMSFVNKDVYKAVTEAKQGDLFNVRAAKNDKGYWQWEEVVAAGKAETKTFSNPGRTFETPEERANKSIQIARMACLERAIQYGASFGKKDTEDTVIARANKFVNYVMKGLEEDKAELPSLNDLPDDIPL